MRARLTVLSVLLVLASLVGCGGTEPNPTGTTPLSAKEQEKQKIASDAQTWKKMTKHDPNNP